MTTSYKDIGYDEYMRNNPFLENASRATVKDIPVGGISTRQVQFMVNPVTNIEFTASDSDTVAWTTGTIYFSNGTDSGLITSGNTGNMSATDHFIYFDRSKGGILETTNVPSLSVGPDKICLAKIYGGDSSKLIVLI